MLYQLGTPVEQVLIEHAAAVLPRVPVRNRDGGARWVRLLDQTTIDAAVMKRSEAANPEAAAKLRDLRFLVEVYTAFANSARELVKSTSPAGSGAAASA